MNNYTCFMDKLPTPCRAKGVQLLFNGEFDCGTKGWTFDSKYPATITDNGDGSIHLKSDSNFGSIVPMLPNTFPDGTYMLTCKVSNVVGTGKMSIRAMNLTWKNSVDITADGEYEFEYTGNIREIHCGASGDSNYEADYEFVSLTREDTDILVDDAGNELVDDYGNTLLARVI